MIGEGMLVEAIYRYYRFCLGVILVLLSFSIVPVCLAAPDAPSPPRVVSNPDLDRFETVREGKRVIHLPIGTYVFSRTISLPSKTTLEGEGPATILRASQDFAGCRFISNYDLRNGNKDITVRSLSVEFSLPLLGGAAPGVLRFENVTNLNIEHVSMDLDTSMYGIDLSARIRSAVVRNCSISNRGRGGGIMVRNRIRGDEATSTDILIQANSLSSLVDEPLAVFGWLGGVNNVRIDQNHIEAGSASFGITVFGVDQVTHTGSINGVKVTGNSVKGGRIGGIAAKGGARGVEITGNIVNGQAADGIFLHTGGSGLPGVSDVVVRCNTLSNAGRHCVFASGTGIIVQENSISNCGAAGIFVSGAVSVIGNKIINSKPGMLVDASGPKTVRSNEVINSSGINVLDNDRSGVEDNIVR
jgi:hypothetical protein